MPIRSWSLAALALATALPAQASWSRVYPSAAPVRRYSHALAGHDQLGDVVLFGGRSLATGAYLNDLWAWNGSQWRVLSSTGAPPARTNHRLVFDAVRQVLVLWGGDDSNAVGFTDTWERVGTQWIQRNPAQAPPRRVAFGMTFDQARGRTVVFGGQGPGGGAYLGDTWEWDGSNWLSRTPGVSPIPRYGPLLAYDPVRQVSVLFGGGVLVNGSSFSVADTWTWNGSQWQVQMPAHQPPPANLVDGVWDRARGRLVTGPIAPAYFSWEWDGQDWRIVLQAPPSQGPMAYDPTRRQVVLYGSQFQAYANHGDTWLYNTPAPALCTRFGSGCAGSAGLPVLDHAEDVWPWLGDTFRTTVAPLAASSPLVVFATGLREAQPVDLTAFGMPGCSGLVTLVALDSVLAAGAAQWSLVLPNRPVLQGLRLAQQAFALELGANAAGVVASNGIEFEVGVR
jgi:hypothetical protein